MIETYEDLLRFLPTMRRSMGGVQAAARQAAESPIGATCEFLVRAIREENAFLRCEALALLSQIVPPLAVQLATEMLKLADPSVRRATCNIIEDLCDTSCEVTLIAHLENESDAEVRFAAVSALRTAGTAACMPLLKYLAATDPSTDYEGRTIAGILPTIMECIECRCIVPKR